MVIYIICHKSSGQSQSLMTPSQPQVTTREVLSGTFSPSVGPQTIPKQLETYKNKQKYSQKTHLKPLILSPRVL